MRKLFVQFFMLTMARLARVTLIAHHGLHPRRIGNTFDKQNTRQHHSEADSNCEIKTHCQEKRGQKTAASPFSRFLRRKNRPILPFSSQPKSVPQPMTPVVYFLLAVQPK